jgi:hypothetical protein
VARAAFVHVPESMVVDVSVVADDASTIEAVWSADGVVGRLRGLFRADGIRGASHSRAVAEYGRKLCGFGEGAGRSVCVGCVQVIVGCRWCCGGCRRHLESLCCV